MKLTIYKIEGHKYSHKDHVMPFVYRLDFEKAMTIGDDIRVNKFFLTHNTDEMVMVGGSACIFRIRREIERVSPEKAKYFLVNVLEDEDEIGELIPGDYTLHAGIAGSIETENGFKAFEVNSELGITIE